MIDYQIPNINKLLVETPCTPGNNGRVNLDLKGSTDKLFLQKVTLDKENCDAGGQNWGYLHKEHHVYCAFNDSGSIQLFTIAPNRKLARQRLYVVYGVRFVS